MLHARSSALIAGASAYALWGMLPIFWKQLKQVNAVEVLAHRVLWSLVFLAVVLWLQGACTSLYQRAADYKVCRVYLLSGLLVACNWGVFIYAVSIGQVLQASLGYFIAPLVHVLLGRLFLKEGLSRPQAIAVLMMTLAVGLLTVWVGEIPFLALVIASSFCFYALVRKCGPLDSLQGLVLETIFLLPLAIGLILYFEAGGRASFLHHASSTDLFLVLSGPVTAIPLLLFAWAAKRLELKTLGMLQFIAPSGQFLLGVFFYHEPFSGMQLLCFAILWVALLLYLVDSRRRVPAREVPLSKG